jgi:heat shock protein HtpX
MFKRIFLFLLTNILVIATISIITSLLGVNGYLSARGIDYRALLIFCFIWGFAGAIISLLMSRFVAKWAMGVKLIDPKTATGADAQLLEIVRDLVTRAKLPAMPEVGIYNSPELNAFATGPSKRNALVAVSSGLLQRMNRDEIEGVLGHEITHVANGDMVTMTLIQGVINSFVLFLSRILAYTIAIAISQREGERANGFPSMLYYLFTFLFDILLTILGSMVVAAFSRYREFRADAGGANLMGTNKMINALKALQKYYEMPQDQRGHSLAALKISQRPRRFSFFASHPSLDERIARLEQQAVNR